MALLLISAMPLVAQEWNEVDQPRLLMQAKKAYQTGLYVRRSYHWPFSAAARASINREFKSTIPLFAYGSLLNAQSAASTFSKETLATSRPAIAFGIKRIFNYDPIYTDQEISTEDPARAMLNVYQTDLVADLVNGVLFDIAKEDLFSLSKREVGYDLIPVLVTTWVEAVSSTTPKFTVAYTLSAPSDARGGRQYTNPNLQPHPGYLKKVDEGASSYGDDFHQLWLETTHLGDEHNTLEEETP